MRNERCAIWSTARLRVLGAQSGTRERTNKSGTCTGNERARRYTRTCSSRSLEREREREEEGKREGNFDPRSFCVCKIAPVKPRFYEVSGRLDSLSLNRVTAESLFEECILSQSWSSIP